MRKERYLWRYRGLDVWVFLFIVINYRKRSILGGKLIVFLEICRVWYLYRKFKWRFLEDSWVFREVYKKDLGYRFERYN